MGRTVVCISSAFRSFQLRRLSLAPRLWPLLRHLVHTRLQAAKGRTPASRWQNCLCLSLINKPISRASRTGPPFWRASSPASRSCKGNPLRMSGVPSKRKRAVIEWPLPQNHSGPQAPIRRSHPSPLPFPSPQRSRIKTKKKPPFSANLS